MGVIREGFGNAFDHLLELSVVDDAAPELSGQDVLDKRSPQGAVIQTFGRRKRLDSMRRLALPVAWRRAT